MKMSQIKAGLEVRNKRGEVGFRITPSSRTRQGVLTGKSRRSSDKRNCEAEVEWPNGKLEYKNIGILEVLKTEVMK